MKKSSLIYLVYSIFSSYNEKIITGLVLVNDDKMEYFFDEDRCNLVCQILNETKCKELFGFINFLKRNINDGTIRPHELKALPNNKGFIEIQSRKMDTILTIDDAVEKFL